MAGQTGRTPITTQGLTDLLESAIVAQRFAPGEKLPSERELAEQYVVSRPVVREVLRRLQERGLIIVQPGRGSFVRELNATSGPGSLDVLVRRGDVTVRELVVARQMIEVEAAALAATEHTESDGARLTTLLDAFDTADNLSTAADLDVAFHEAITVASGNTVVQIMFAAIRPLTRSMVLRSLTDREIRRVGAPVHHHVLDAILAGDAQTARDAMRHHLQLAEQLYGEDLDRPLREILQRWAGDRPELASLLRSEDGDEI